MSSNEISKTLKELYELRAMRTELDDEITALEDRVKKEMTERQKKEEALQQMMRILLGIFLPNGTPKCVPRCQLFRPQSSIYGASAAN